MMIYHVVRGEGYLSDKISELRNPISKLTEFPEHFQRTLTYVTGPLTFCWGIQYTKYSHLYKKQSSDMLWS